MPKKCHLGDLEIKLSDRRAPPHPFTHPFTHSPGIMLHTGAPLEAQAVNEEEDEEENAAAFVGAGGDDDDDSILSSDDDDL